MGPAQSGKTTLARLVGAQRGYAYLTFDDAVARESASADPAGFVDTLPPHVILDEVQRVPALFTALKAAVDRNSVPGRFFLTGSSNVLLVPSLADSLAGRMEILRLFPLAQTELGCRRDSGFLAALMTRELPDATIRTPWSRIRRAHRRRRVSGCAGPPDAPPASCLVPRLPRCHRAARRAQSRPPPFTRYAAAPAGARRPRFPPACRTSVNCRDRST